MDDQLKNIIQSKRSEFDALEDVRTDLIWKGIENDLSKKRLNRWLLAVLVICLLAGALTYSFIHIKINRSEVSPTIMAALTVQTQGYEELANRKMFELNFTSLQGARYDELLDDLAELDIRHQEINSELKEYGLNDDIISKFIKYHERKLRILELLMKEKEYQSLEKSKEYEM